MWTSRRLPDSHELPVHMILAKLRDHLFGLLEWKPGRERSWWWRLLQTVRNTWS